MKNKNTCKINRIIGSCTKKRWYRSENVTTLSQLVQIPNSCRSIGIYYKYKAEMELLYRQALQMVAENIPI